MHKNGFNLDRSMEGQLSSPQRRELLAELRAEEQARKRPRYPGVLASQRQTRLAPSDTGLSLNDVVRQLHAGGTTERYKLAITTDPKFYPPTPLDEPDVFALCNYDLKTKNADGIITSQPVKVSLMRYTLYLLSF